MTLEICPDGSRQTENQLVDLARPPGGADFIKTRGSLHLDHMLLGC